MRIRGAVTATVLAGNEQICIFAHSGGENSTQSVGQVNESASWRIKQTTLPRQQCFA